MGLVVVTHPKFIDHHTGSWHPERPARLDAVFAGIEQSGVGDAVIPVESEPATPEAIARVHRHDLVDDLRDLVRHGGGQVDPDTVVSGGSVDAAVLAAGAGPTAIARLDAGEGSAAFCVVRPPGHHATPDRSMGFCLLNNVAVAARFLADRGERVAIVDYDAHHGNGTQDIFYEDPAVLYVSLHEYPLYPGTGRFDEIGAGAGTGSTVNIPLPAGSTGDVWIRSMAELVLPELERFAPTWLMISAGFDGHRADPLTGLSLSAGDFGSMTTMLLPLVRPGRRLVFLEGGYDLDALRNSTAAMVAALLDEEHRPEPSSSGGAGHDVVESVLRWRYEAGLA